MAEIESKDRSGAGGTPGGVGEFLLGLAMAVAGAYLLMNQVTVTSGFWSLFGHSAFGLTLLPLVIGIGILFFNGRSWIGWLLTGAGTVIIFVAILVNMQIFFRPTSLFNTLVMLVLLAGGVGLVARGVRAH
jgi:uncharacterized protein